VTGSVRPAGGRIAYLAFVTPGILLIALLGGATNTAIAVSMDMTEGILARFRTMSIARGSVLTGHVIVGVLQAVPVQPVDGEEFAAAAPRSWC